MDTMQKRFALGLFLVWLPSVPLIISLFYILSTVSTSRTTGLGVIVGAWGEAYAGFPKLGLGLSVVLEAAAIVLLLSAFASKHWISAVISISWSGFLILLYGFSLWFLLVKLPRMS
jgi:hypothetical protein